MPILSMYDPQMPAVLKGMLQPILESPVVWLYIGPDQIMPLASVFSAIVGIVLMFWHKLVSVATRSWQLVARRGRPRQPAPQSEPAD